MLLTLSGAGTLGQQIFRAMREAILAGRLRPGDRIPVSRTLAKDLAVSRNVVLIAYEQLAAEGYTVARVGSGTYVSALLPDSMTRAPITRDRRSGSELAPRMSHYASRMLADAAADPPLAAPVRRARYDFAYYLTNPKDVPASLWSRILARRVRRMPVDYSGVHGDEPLRIEIARYLARARGIDCDPRQILIVNGTQQAFDLIARVLLNSGDEVVMEDPHYVGAREVFRAMGARILPLPVDDAGLQVSRLARRRSTRLAFVTPSHQFPTGAVMSLDRRLALLAWAERNDSYILEDDYDGEYSYEGRPIEAVLALDGGGRVIYANSFSRMLFPSLRIGYIVAPQPLMRALSQAKWIMDRHTPLLQQGALADFLKEGHFDRAIRRARVRNLARLHALLGAMDNHFGARVLIRGTSAGVHVMARFPQVPASHTAAWITAAAKLGVRVYPTGHYYMNHASAAGCCELMLGYAGLTARQITGGIRLLASVSPT